MRWSTWADYSAVRSTMSIKHAIAARHPVGYRPYRVRVGSDVAVLLKDWGHTINGVPVSLDLDLGHDEVSVDFE